ncbi:hypothetical protein ACFY1C_19170 [Streptomyces sp. NPDC001279]|uniref:hypothetical protein n=1 Tax=Streptomyces sp. NPDC001279 TaxID=3364556 RepID=UPI0036A0E492
MAQVPDFVSLNGPDNVGKTTHLVRLTGRWDGFQPLGSVHEHDPEPWARVAAADYARWWFETSTTVELTEMLLVGHAKRAAAREAGCTGLLDRGLPMLLAVATATCVVKDGLTVGEAFKTITGIAGSRATAPNPAEAGRSPAELDNRFSTMTEVRRVAWPAYEDPKWSDPLRFQQGIAGSSWPCSRSTPPGRIRSPKPATARSTCSSGCPPKVSGPATSCSPTPRSSAPCSAAMRACTISGGTSSPSRDAGHRGEEAISVSGRQVALELDDIQRGVLAPRPTPYAATYLVFHIGDRAHGRELMRRASAVVTSAADSVSPSGETWVSVALTSHGLEVLGVPSTSLETFAWEFRQGMAARARALGDDGESSPEHWEAPLGTPDVHVVLTAVAPDPERLEAAIDRARPAYEQLTGVTAIWRQECYALPTETEHFGYRDGVSHPVVEGSGIAGSNRLETPLKAGEFVLSYRTRSAASRCRSRRRWDATAATRPSVNSTRTSPRSAAT